MHGVGLFYYENQQKMLWKLFRLNTSVNHETLHNVSTLTLLGSRPFWYPSVESCIRLCLWMTNILLLTVYLSTRPIKPRPHMQQRRINIVECYKSNDSFDKVETNWTQIEKVQFVSTLSKGRNFTNKTRSTLLPFGNKVECCFEKVERCFEIAIAGVDGA